MMPRLAETVDKAEYRKVWEQSFPDEKSFVDFFFEKRFFPSWSVGSYEDGKLVSCLHSLPLTILVRGRQLPCAMVAGVATLPEYGGKGYMRQTFTFYLREMAKRQLPFIVHTPAHLPTFFKLGHMPVSTTAYILTQSAPPQVFPQGIELIDPLANLDALTRCYNKNAARYSGIVSRSREDFRLKTEDYLSVGAKFAARFDGAEISCYCAYFDEKDRIFAEELMCGNASDSALLVQYLTAAAKGKGLRVKLAPDILPATTLPYEIKPQGVAGLVRPDLALNMLGGGLPYKIKITDDTLPENSGIYDFCGNRAQGGADLEMTAGALTQWLFGYCSLKELAEQERAQIFSKKALDELDQAFPVQNCFIVDEY